MITTNKPAMEYYLTSLVLNYSSLKKGTDYVFYMYMGENEVMHEPFLGRGETLKTYQEIVHERPLIKFEEYMKTVRKKTMTNTRMTIGLLATLDAITSNSSRKTIPIIQVENGRKIGFSEAPLCDYTGAFRATDKSSILSGQLRQVYRDVGPKFTVNKSGLIKALTNVSPSPIKESLMQSLKRYPEVFR